MLAMTPFKTRHPSTTEAMHMLKAYPILLSAAYELRSRNKYSLSAESIHTSTVLELSNGRQKDSNQIKTHSLPTYF